MFAGLDPFSDVYPFAPAPARGNDSRKVYSIPPTPLTGSPVVSKGSQPTSQIAESSQMALERESFELTTSSLILRHLKIPASVQPKGWYVVFHGTAPGVSHGS